MKHIIILATLIFALSNCLHAQIEPTISENTLSDAEKNVLSQHFRNYKTFSIDKKEILDSLNNKGKCQFRLNIDKENDWIIDIRVNDMRSNNFVASYISDSGTFKYDGFILNTFKGKTSDNKVVRFTIDVDEFWGIILDNEKQIVIRQTKDYTKNEKDESLILYRRDDLIVQKDDFDRIDDALFAPIDNNLSPNTLRSASLPCTYYLELATDADFEFYQSMGNNLTNTYSYIFSVLNLIEGVYESTFDLRFIVTFQNVWTTSSDPYTTTDANSLLSQFRTEWNSNRTGITRDIAHLFTGKDLDGSTIGIGWLGQIGTSYAYSLSMFRTEMFETTAHEMGHNLDANHPTASNCLCGTSTASVMCQGQKDNNLWFCQESINEISPFLADNSAKLTGNLQNYLTLSGTVTGFQEYQAIEKITSTQVINSGLTIYKANGVELNGGFEVKAGAEFEITIDDNGCD
jgi:hypothetical protein